MAKLEDKIPVNLLVGDRTYRVKIHRKNEELVRKTMKMINDNVRFYKTNFAGKDMQDYISMALIWFATEQNITGEMLLREEETNNKLNKLDHLLNRYLDEEKKEE